MIRYVSTRSKADSLAFNDVVLAGLAPDGGLYLPESLPEFSPADIASMAGLSYAELAFRIMQPFTEGQVEDEALRRMIDESYANFRHEAIAPLQQISERHFVLELFHGPTLAFKDFALQFLGRLLDHLLTERGQKAVIVGATSGDTGSAAIAGCSGRKNLDIYILHPKGRVSDVQRRQMTTVPDDNVHNIAVEGTFDDCQDIVKTLFADKAFNDVHNLVAVNSINWARIMAQIVYYFYAALALGAPAKRVSFSVPTGNFGDIFAGYLAKKMGLPVDRLIIASNRNDILTRCVRDADFSMRDVNPSLSPSMDIQISSNFERLLFDLCGRDSEAISALMQEFRKNKKVSLSPGLQASICRQFDAYAASDEQTRATIKDMYESTGMVVDPHTAVGIFAAQHSITQNDAHVPVVTLATAHPAKFADAVHSAIGLQPELPPHLHHLHDTEERYETCANDADAVKNLIERTQ